jgi:hypothetical protein
VTFALCGDNGVPDSTVGGGAGPDFLVIGVQKAGTSWLNANLAREPRIRLLPLKELHYFDEVHFDPQLFSNAANASDDWRRFRARRLENLLEDGISADRLSADGKLRDAMRILGGPPDGSVAGDAWYLSLFPRVPGRAGGEMTPDYAALPPAGIKHAARLLGPNGKVVMILRDPAERAISSVLHKAAMRAAIPPAEVLQLLPMHDVAAWRLVLGLNTPETVPTKDPRLLRLAAYAPAILARSEYRRAIENWDAEFPYGSRLMIFWHDDIVDRPLDMLNSVVRFLLGTNFTGDKDKSGLCIHCGLLQRNGTLYLD